MSFHTPRLLILLLCIGLLTFQVYGLKKKDLVLRRKEEDGLPLKRSRTLTGSDVVNLDAKRKPATGSSSVDPNGVCKRRVRRGSDPIHNRC